MGCELVGQLWLSGKVSKSGSQEFESLQSHDDTSMSKTLDPDLLLLLVCHVWMSMNVLATTEAPLQSQFVKVHFLDQKTISWHNVYFSKFLVSKTKTLSNIIY